MKPIFIDETRKTFSEQSAEEKLKEKNDLRYLTPSGIVEVDKLRWKEAQAYERGTWMSGKGLGLKDDRNKFHENNFDNYSVIRGRTFKNVIELGCGPFTNITRIMKYVSCEKVTLLDPLINDYLQHPSCRYKNNILKYDRGFLQPFYKKKSVLTVAEPIEEFSVNETYDLIILINVLEHCFSAQKVFDNILSLSSKKGIIVFHDKLIPDRDLTEIASKIYDSGHPLRVAENEILKFLCRNYKELFKKYIEMPIKDIYTFNSIYFIGELC